MTGPLLAKHVRYTKAREPWDKFIFPTAKNTANAMAWALVSDGWAFDAASGHVTRGGLCLDAGPVGGAAALMPCRDADRARQQYTWPAQPR